MTKKQRILKHLGNVAMAILLVSLITSPALAVDSAEVAGQVIGAEGSTKATKEALNYKTICFGKAGSNLLY